MVRILANGDIVADDDPRAQQASRRQGAQSAHGGFQSSGDFRDQEPVQQVSIFQVLNQRLLGYGIPRWNIGDIVIEPIVSVGLLLALLLFGIHGLIFGIILFLVSRWSQHGAPEVVSRFFGGGGRGGQGGSGGNGDRRQGRAGGGYRLGR